MKGELAFRTSGSVNGGTHVNGNGSGKDKDKDKTFVIGVETKTERVFVVLTSGKSQTYAASDASVTSTWVEKIKSALESHQSWVRT